MNFGGLLQWDKAKRRRRDAIFKATVALILNRLWTKFSDSQRFSDVSQRAAPYLNLCDRPSADVPRNCFETVEETQTIADAKSSHLHPRSNTR